MEVREKPKTGKSGVLLVDDHPVVRERISELINEQPDLEVVGEADSFASALAFLEKCQPAIAIVDITLSNGPNGLELIKNMAVRFPDLPVLVFSAHEESLYAERVLRAGAKGYVSKMESTVAVVEGIRRVLKGEIFLSSKLSASIVKQFFSSQRDRVGSPIERLTDRELEVFQLIGRGRTSREISQQLHLEPKTVETYRGRIKVKLNLSSATELHQAALQWLQDSGTPDRPG